MVMASSKRRTARLSKMILSSSVGVGGGVQMGMMVSDDVGEDSIEVVVVVPSIVAAIVVVGVGVVGLRGVALPSVALMFSVSASGFTFSWRTFACWAREWSIFLRLFLLPWSHRGVYIER